MKSMDETKKSVETINEQLKDELSGDVQIAKPKAIHPIPIVNRKFDETNKNAFKDEPADKRRN